MCQKQIEALTQIGVSVEVKNNKNHLICQKDNLIVDYYPTRESWFIRGDNTKNMGFDALVKQFKSQQVKPQESPAINSQGLTIRDYFATHAMEGMVTDVVIDAQKIARMAYEVADAMMRERMVNHG